MQNKKNQKNVSRLLMMMLAAAFFTLPLKAQVNIGDQTAPHSFSLLELTTKNQDRGLRMPQLTTDQREALGIQLLSDANVAKEAKGLIIYNTDTKCLQYWNGKKWISLYEIIKN